MKDIRILQDLKKNWNLKSALPEPKEENKYFLFSVLYNKSSYYKSLIFPSMIITILLLIILMGFMFNTIIIL